ncbi:hypothetical protein DJ031_07165 [bacterium endosymbiont of Escarpia laminata]|nr:MAG: hypothetical protein DJ031_07165 [bacterium endosymbiont of Escarpia laminata]
MWLRSSYRRFWWSWGMSEWENYALSNVANIQIGGTPSREVSAYWAGTFDPGFPWVSIADLNTRVITETKETITRKGILNSNVKLVSAGTLIMSFKLSIGRTALAGVDLFTNEAIAAIVTQDRKVNPELLYYVLPPVAKAAITDTAVKGSTLNKASLGKLRIKVPTSYAQQAKISHILQTIDQTIEKTEALIEKQQQIKAGLMHDLFTRGIGPDGKLRPPREQAPELYQQTPIGWIPKKWQYATIDAVKEGIVDGPFGSNLKTEHYVSDPGVRVVRLQNIQATIYNDKDRAFVSDKHANSLFRNKVVGSDILIAGLGEERYPVGRACLYPDELPPSINKADCFRLRCLDGVVHNGFLMYFLNTWQAKSQVRKYEQGVTRPRINLGNMKKVFVPKPKPEEQITIFSRLEELTAKVNAETTYLNKLSLQKSGLMHDLLTGKVQVNIDQPEVSHA